MKKAVELAKVLEKVEEKRVKAEKEMFSELKNMVRSELSLIFADIKKECKNYDFFEKGLTKKKAKVSGYGIGLFIFGVITLFLTFMLELDNLYNLLNKMHLQYF